MTPYVTYHLTPQEGVARKKLQTFKKDLKKYGITPEQYFTLWERQGKVCACCGSTKPNGRGWCVDHDHQLNKVRGILCSKCNLGIGHLGDTLEAVKKAVSYLEKFYV